MSDNEKPALAQLGIPASIQPKGTPSDPAQPVHQPPPASPAPQLPGPSLQGVTFTYQTNSGPNAWPPDAPRTESVTVVSTRTGGQVSEKP